MHNITSLNNDEQLLSQWLAIIGMITMFWSPVERNIDQCTHIIYSVLGKKSGRNKKPLRLSEKIEFIRENSPKNIFNSKSIEKLCESTLSTSKVRDIFVHGLIHEFNENEIKITKIDGKRSEHLIEIFTFDFARLEKSAYNLKLIQKEWADLSHAIYNYSMAEPED